MIQWPLVLTFIKYSRDLQLSFSNLTLTSLQWPLVPRYRLPQLPQYSQYSLKHRDMEHYYLLSILSINLRNTSKLLWAITVLTEKGQKRGCAWKASMENILLFWIHFVFSSKGKITRYFRSKAKSISIKPLSSSALSEVLIFFKGVSPWFPLIFYCSLFTESLSKDNSHLGMEVPWISNSSPILGFLAPHPVFQVNCQALRLAMLCICLRMGNKLLKSRLLQEK